MEPSGARYQHLGAGAFWVFFFQKSLWFLGFFLALIILVTLITTVPIDTQFVVLAVKSLYVLLGLFIIATIVALTTSWMQYIAYKFMLDDNALRIKSGIFNIEVEAIPYRQIQNVDIERDILYRMLGVSRLVILTAGEGSGPHTQESEGIIPALDKYLAEKIQEDLMHRANIEKVMNQDGSHEENT